MSVYNSIASMKNESGLILTFGAISLAPSQEVKFWDTTMSDVNSATDSLFISLKIAKDLFLSHVESGNSIGGAGGAGYASTDCGSGGGGGACTNLLCSSGGQGGDVSYDGDGGCGGVCSYTNLTTGVTTYTGPTSNSGTYAGATYLSL